MSATFLFVVIFSVLPMYQAEYLLLPVLSEHDDSARICEDFGRILLELRSQADLDLWNAARGSTTYSTSIYWMGLVRNASAPMGYSWMHGGAATWFKWTTDGEPDNMDTELCVGYDITADGFRTMPCLDHYLINCQDEVGIVSERETTYIRTTNVVVPNTSTLSKFKLDKLPQVESTWQVLATSSPAMSDVDACLMECHVQPTCELAYFPNAGFCLMFLNA